MIAITNIAAYRFTRLEGLPELRERLLTLCKAGNLKGTILLSTEGINLFVAGKAGEIANLISFLQAIPGLESLAPKYSESADQPFSRMLVRIKKEIIAFGVDGIEPGRRTSPKLAARELKQWLDEGRPVTLLDTRNDYEVKLGTFRGAKVLGIDHFREFPKAVENLSPQLKQTPIVMFCTGGIRCEKAGPYMEREGFQHIFQLDGGILKYFEEVGADHYDGECFVFDHRVGVDPALSETDSAICFICQTTLGPVEQSDPRYLPNISCPYCHATDAEKTAASIARHQAAADRLGISLPGSRPYLDERPFRIPPGSDGESLGDVMTRVFPETNWEKEIQNGLLQTAERTPVDLGRIVRSGERFLRMSPAAVEPTVDPRLRILHEDEALVVVEKRATLPLLPGSPFKRNTLQYLLSQVYAPQKIQPIDTLATEDSGLVVCARSRHFSRLMKQPPPQFTWLVAVEKWSHNCGGFCLVRHDSAGAFILETTLTDSREVRARLEQAGISLQFPTALHAWKMLLIHPLSQAEITLEATLPDWAKADS